MVWVGLGAAAGILAYRKGQQFLAESREQGLATTVQQLVDSGQSAVATAQRMIAPRPEKPGGARGLR
jgi:hypothetical protein